METTKNPGAEAAVQMTPELQEEVRMARLCFTSIERLSTLMAGYPPGHPVVEKAVEAVREAFYQFFEINDRLSIQVHPHWMVLSGTDKVVWETDEPKDYCFALSRDGIYLIHILAGIDMTEVRRFVEILNELVDQRDMSSDAVSLFFEAGFRYLSYDALDESMAQLAGLDSDIRDRDTREEQEMIEELFNDAFDKGAQEAQGGASGGDTKNNQDFEIRMKVQASKQQKLEVGSRQFLLLDDDAQKHLLELKKGFTEHNELEHREGEVLSALLGARPKDKLRLLAVEQIGEVMGNLIETEQPWEALSFLKLIHHWRDKFGPEVADELKEVVKSSFSDRRVQVLVKQLSRAEASSRRAILQMFNALHLESASAKLVQLLAWELADDAREDILRYIKERARYGLGFVEDSISEMPSEHVGPLVDLLVEAMPRSRSSLVKIVKAPGEPPLKVKVLEALHGTWTDTTEIRDTLIPLLQVSNSELRVVALRSFAKAAPQHVFRVLESSFTDKLAKRPDEEVREMVNIFVSAGGPPSLEKLKELLHKRGLVAEDEQELAVVVARALIQTPHPAVIKLLEGVGKDWLVPGRIRSQCKEIADLLQAGRA